VLGEQLTTSVLRVCIITGYTISEPTPPTEICGAL